MTTETLSLDELLPTKFELKTSQRWILEAQGLDAFLVKKVTLPKWSAKDGEPQILTPLEVELYDAIAPNSAQQVMEFCTKSSIDSLPIKIKLLDPCGTVISKWDLGNVKVRMVDFGLLDYSDGKPITIKAAFDVEKMEISS